MPKGIAISLRRFAPTYGCVQHTQGVVVRAVTCTSIAPEVAGKKKKKMGYKKVVHQMRRMIFNYRSTKNIPIYLNYTYMNMS